MPEHVQYQMGYSEPEFEKVLKGDFSGANSAYVCLDNGDLSWRLKHRHDPMQVTIRIRQDQPRQLGMLRLPVLQVSFALQDATHTARTAFFDRFFKYFHKGGG